MSVVLLGGLLLAVSLISVVIYMAALGQLLVGEHQPGMIRTAVCRLLAALLYVGVALLTLHTNETGPLIGLGVFTAVQLMWQFNSIADVRLTRKQRRMAAMPERDLGPRPSPSKHTLKEAVVSAEIDRLSSNATTASSDVTNLRTDIDAVMANQRWWLAGLIFTFVVAATGCVLGLTGGENVTGLVERNSSAIATFREARDQIFAAMCAEHGVTLGSYNPRTGATYPGGERAYDAHMRKVVISAGQLECNLSVPPGLPPE